MNHTVYELHLNKNRHQNKQTRLPSVRGQARLAPRPVTRADRAPAARGAEAHEGGAHPGSPSHLTTTGPELGTPQEGQGGAQPTLQRT